jgi:hypothetical protein
MAQSSQSEQSRLQINKNRQTEAAAQKKFNIQTPKNPSPMNHCRKTNGSNKKARIPDLSGIRAF